MHAHEAEGEILQAMVHRVEVHHGVDHEKREHDEEQPAAHHRSDAVVEPHKHGLYGIPENFRYRSAVFGNRSVLFCHWTFLSCPPTVGR